MESRPARRTLTRRRSFRSSRRPGGRHYPSGQFRTVNTGASTISVSRIWRQGHCRRRRLPVDWWRTRPGPSLSLYSTPPATAGGILAGALRIQWQRRSGLPGPQWKQVKDDVASQKSSEVDWADVVSRPNVAIQAHYAVVRQSGVV